MSKSVLLYPYEMSTGLVLELSDFDDPTSGAAVDVHSLGSENEADEDEQPATRGYDASKARWKKLTFRLTARLPDQDRARILPATSAIESDAALIVQVTCPSTKFRHGVGLLPGKPGTWHGDTVVQREDVQGIVSLRPQLIRLTGIPEAESVPYATEAGTVIATGEAAALYVDVAPALGLHSTVSISWEDFANSENLWRREHQDDVFHLEPFISEPRLYLNSRYAQLREIMESDAKRGGHAVTRDMMASIIAQTVLLQLATAAFVGIETDEEAQSVTSPSGWRGDLLRSVLPRLYPEEASDDYRLHRAADEIREGDGATSLLARLGSVVQEMVGAYKTVESVIRFHETARGKEETTDE